MGVGSTVKPIGMAVALAVIGLAIGYISAMPFLAPQGRLAAGAVGLAIGLALARALWTTRHGAGDPDHPHLDEGGDLPQEPVADEPQDRERRADE